MLGPPPMRADMTPAPAPGLRHRPGARVVRPHDQARATRWWSGSPSSGTATSPPRGADVSPPQLMTNQNDLLRRYSDLAANPTANVPRPRLRGRGGAGDAALPHRRGQHPAGDQRELRPRADGALLPRRHQRGRPAQLLGDRRPRGRARRLGLADRRREPGRGHRLLQPLALGRRAEDRARQGRRVRPPRAGRRGPVPPEPRPLPGDQAVGRVHPDRAGRRHAARPGRASTPAAASGSSRWCAAS